MASKEVKTKGNWDDGDCKQSLAEGQSQTQEKQSQADSGQRGFQMERGEMILFLAAKQSPERALDLPKAAARSAVPTELAQTSIHQQLHCRPDQEQPLALATC